MTTSTNIAPRLAYLVSTYPAISHTFILREVLRLRELGHDIVTASINRPDRARSAMQAQEGAEADDTFCLKAQGVKGALRALGFQALRSPHKLAAVLRIGLGLGSARRPWVGLAYAVEAAMVARWMHQQNTQHLHVHFGNVGATVGMLVKQLNGCHLSYTIHGPDEFDDVPGQHLALKMRQADAVVCISQFARGQLMRISAPSDWPKFQLCRLGVTPEQFDFQLRGATRSAADVPQLLCVGRLTPAKCQTLLVQACARLRDAGSAFHLTLVGEGPDRARVEAAIDQLGLHSHITLTGALSQEAVRQRLALADVFVLPSLAEGIPVVLMEAMASGLPCISTPVNGIPELIEHNRTGLLALPGDIDSLVAQLDQLIHDAALRDTLAQSAHAKVLADFDLMKNVDRLSQIFQNFPVSH